MGNPLCDNSSLKIVVTLVLEVFKASTGGILCIGRQLVALIIFTWPVLLMEHIYQMEGNVIINIITCNVIINITCIITCMGVGINLQLSQKIDFAKGILRKCRI